MITHLLDSNILSYTLRPQNVDIADKLYVEIPDLYGGVGYARAAFEEKLKRFCEDNRVLVRYAAEVAALKSDDFWRAVAEWVKQKGKDEEFSANSHPSGIKQKAGSQSPES